jgi:hypothetical protein
MMRINRNLAASLAIVGLLFAGLVITQLKSDKPAVIQTEPAASSSPTESPSQDLSIVSEEPSVEIEDPNPNNLPASNIWTYNCEIPVQLPESFLLTCADGGWYVYNIKWQSWGKKEAKATAIYSENVCEPNCAEGYRVEAPVTLTLTTFAKPSKKIYLTNLVMNASTEKYFKNGARTLTWDLGEFAKMMESE